MRSRIVGGVATVLVAGLLAAVAAPARAAELHQGSVVTHPNKRKGKGDAAAAAWHARHSLYFRRNRGIDVIGIRRVSSGLMLRFDYRVVDPARAGALDDKKTKPYVIDEATGTALAVPAMENVGELRQVAPFQPDRIYFIIFGNPGGLVKKGGRVTLVVGDLRAEGLPVD